MANYKVIGQERGEMVFKNTLLLKNCKTESILRVINGSSWTVYRKTGNSVF
jgi:hypothetical protein